MTFALLASSIILVILIAYENYKHRYKQDANTKSFWKRESLANSTRRQPLDNLPYITIPLEKLPMEAMKEDPQVSEYYQLLEYLSTCQIVNFTGISNTELKLKYGTANLLLLSNFDQNYTSLVHTLHVLAERLLQNDYKEEARIYLEFAISLRTDISQSYYMLADLYRSTGEAKKIDELILIAKSLNSIMKGIIVRTLQESDQ